MGEIKRIPEPKKIEEKNKLIQEMLSSGEQIKNFYRFTAQNPHIPLHDACQIIIQNQGLGVCYSFDEWAERKRRINRGERGYKYINGERDVSYVFEASQTHGENRFVRTIYPLKRLLDGLYVLNGSDIANANNREYQKILSGIAIYLQRNDYFTDDDKKNRLLGEGIAYSLYSKTAFPKDDGIKLTGFPYSLNENALLFSQINEMTNVIQKEIEEAYQEKAREVKVIDDTEEDSVSDEVYVEEKIAERDMIDEKYNDKEFTYPLEQEKKGSPLYQEYMSMQDKYKDAVVVMRVGDFYEVMGEKAKLVADKLDLILTDRDCGLDERVPMCGFPYHIAEKYIDKILEISGAVVLEPNEEPKYLLSHEETLMEYAESIADTIEDEEEKEERPKLEELSEEESKELDKAMGILKEPLTSTDNNVDDTKRIKKICDYIIKEGTEKTDNGNYILTFNEVGNVDYIKSHIEEIKKELWNREEVLDVVINNDEFDMDFGTDYCPNYIPEENEDQYDFEEGDELEDDLDEEDIDDSDETEEETAETEKTQNTNKGIKERKKKDKPQLSMFDMLDGKTNEQTPEDKLTETELTKGSGFSLGKYRIYDKYNENPTVNEFATFLSHEYGIGGYSGPDSNSGSYDGKGVRFSTHDESVKVVLKWNEVAIKIADLIDEDKYFTEQEKVLYQKYKEEQLKKSFRDLDAEEDKEWESRIESGELKPIPREESQNTDLTAIGFNQSELGGAKQRFRGNVDAIKLVDKLFKENRNPTDSEKKVLAKYVGWGGLAEAFDENNEKWKKEYTELKELLSADDYDLAKGSVLNAHFTPKEVIEGIYRALEKFGVKGNNKILEPAMGVGNFFGFMPKSIQENAKLYGVELDNITGKIATKLYPNAKIQIKGFEQTNFSDNYFDLVVSNVPFGNYSVYDSAYSKNSFQIHDYFIAKSIDKLKPNGIMAVITSKGTMDKLTSNVRKYIADRAELVGAIRLPNTAFRQTANTQVTSDILFFRKREEKIDSNEENTAWLKTNKNEQGFELNQYFIDHPVMVCGTLAEERGLYGLIDLTVKADDRTITEAINDAIENLPKDIYVNPIKEEIREENKDEKIEVDFDIRPLCLKIVGDKLYMREGDEMVKQEIPSSPKDAFYRIKQMIEMRQSVRDILQLQLKGCNDTDLQIAQWKLNTQYDIFVKKYGYINNQTNLRLFKDDADSALLSAIEEVSEDKTKVTKADIFTKRTIRPYVQIQSTDDCFEALQISKNEKGKVDIAYIEELTKKDYDTVLRELGNAVFRNPKYVIEDDKYSGFETQAEYLSGEIFLKLSYAQFNVSNGHKEYERNVEALKQVLPRPLTASEISVKVGASWIDPEIYKQFIFETFSFRGWEKSYFDISFNAFDGSWTVSTESCIRSSKRLEITNVWGTERANAFRLFEDLLNQKDTKVFDTIEEDGKKRSVLNKNETIKAREKKNRIQEQFKKWIFSNPERRDALVDTYNSLFNQVVLPKYDGSYLKFPEMNPSIEPRPHQKDAIHRIVSTGNNTLLHHVVGSGKTLTMVASGMKLRQYGLAKKPMYVVPNHLVNQWANEFRRYYPNVNVLVTEKDDLDKDKRKRFVSKVALGDWDGIIIAQSTFAKINVSIERQIKKLREEISKVEETIFNYYAETENPRGAVKSLEKTKKSKEAQLQKLLDDSKKDDVLKFEDLGVDYLFVDEADAYKNLFLYTKMTNVAGISTAASKRASDLKLKVEYINELHGGDKGVVFATGTPISNSMAEMYTLQTYLQNGTLQKLGMTYFDLWAANFGETINSLELAPSGQGYRSKTRFAKFTNLPELLTMYRSFADVQTSDMVKLDVPDAIKRVITIKPSESTVALTEDIANRAESIYLGGVDPRIDNMLKVTSDGKKLALDPRCYDVGLQDEENSKLTECANNIFEVYQNSQDVKGTQLVFCDLSTPKKAFSDYVYGKDFDAYNDLKYKLVKLGIPENEIAFIHDANSDLQKQALFNKVNDGAVRVLVGSTEKCGAGTNVQKRLVAIHHLDAPYRPRDFTQRNGRGIRQGNMNKEIQIFTYVTERTFDSYSYQILENKQRFISQIDRGDLTTREAEDIDEATLTYAEIKAITSANPKIKRKMELDNELQRLRVLESQFNSNLYDLQDKIRKTYPEKIQKQKLFIERLKKDIETTSKLYDPEKFSINVKGITYTDRKEGGQDLQNAINENMTNMVIAEYCGLKISLDPMVLLTTRTVTIKGEGQYNENVTTMAYSTMNRIVEFVENLPNDLQVAEERLNQFENELSIAKEEVNKPFEYAEQISNILSELTEINAELDLNKKEEVVMVDEEEKGEEYMALLEDMETIKPQTKRYKAKMNEEIEKLYSSEQEKSPNSYVFISDNNNYFVLGEKSEEIAKMTNKEVMKGSINGKETSWVAINDDEFGEVVRKLGDEKITVKIIEPTKKQESFIEVEDTIEQMQVDVVPDYSVSQEYMHEYGYLWNGMLPLCKERAYTLYSMGLGIFTLDKDNNEFEVKSVDDLNRPDKIFGIEKDVWNRFLTHKETNSFLMARQILCTALSKMIDEDLSEFDRAITSELDDDNYQENEALKQYLQGKEIDNEKTKGYLTLLFQETIDALSNLPFADYGWNVSDIQETLVSNVENEEYREHLKGDFADKYKSEVDKIIEEMDLMETEEMLNVKEVNYKEEVIKSVEEENEEFNEGLEGLETKEFVGMSYALHTRQVITDFITNGLLPNEVYKKLYEDKGRIVEICTNKYIDADIDSEEIDDGYRQAIYQTVGYVDDQPNYGTSEEPTTEGVEEFEEEIEIKDIGDYREAVIKSVEKEYEKYQTDMLKKSSKDIFYNCYGIYVKNEIFETIQDGEYLTDEEYRTLYDDKGSILSLLRDEFISSEGFDVETYSHTADFIKYYCENMEKQKIDNQTKFFGYNENNTDYYHFKEKLTLDLFQRTIEKQGTNDEYVIASPVSDMSEEEMKDHDITFLEIGRDIKEEELLGDNESVIYNMEKAESHKFPVNARYYNNLCAIDIEEAINNNFDGSHLNTDFEDKIIDKYGIDRVNYVLACNVLDNLDDGRFRAETKEWAKTIPIAKGDIIDREMRVDVHQEVLNGFIQRIMKKQKQELRREEQEMPENSEEKKKWLKVKVPYDAIISEEEKHFFMKMSNTRDYEGYTYNFFRNKTKDSVRVVDDFGNQEDCLELLLLEDETIKIRKGEDTKELSAIDFITAVKGTQTQDYERKVKGKKEYVKVVLPQSAMENNYGKTTLLFMPSNSEYAGYSYYVPSSFITEDTSDDKGNIVLEIPSTFEIRLKNVRTNEEVNITVDELLDVCKDKTIDDYGKLTTEGQEINNSEQDNDDWLHIAISKDSKIVDYDNSTLFRMPSGEYSNYLYYLPKKCIKENKEKGTYAVNISKDFEISLKDNEHGKKVILTAEEYANAVKGKENEKIKKLFNFKERKGKFTKEVAKRLKEWVPEEMKARDNWIVVCTKYDKEKEKVKKFLIDANNSGFAESDNPKTWTSFENAVKFALEKGADAIAYALDGKDNIACIDLDHCKDERGEYSPLAKEVLSKCGKTYIENSVSGTGLHIFGTTKGLDVRTFSKDGQLEFYQKEHFITMTADGTSFYRLESFDNEQMKELIERKCEKRVKFQGIGKGIEGLSSMSDREVVEKAMNGAGGETFKKLMDGVDILNDHSRSDMSLMCRLAFYCNGDKEQMLRIFATSGLFRYDKSPDYYECTAIKSLQNTTSRYQPQQTKSHSKSKGGFNSK